MTEKQQEKIDEIMDNFNFERVHKVMEFLNWSWHNKGVPEIFQLKSTARKQLKEAYKNARKDSSDGSIEGCCISGGFDARYFSGEDEDGPWENFKLSFVLEDWQTEEE